MVLLTVAAAESGANPRVGVFSDLEPGGIPEGWEPMRFPKIRQGTEYSLIEEDGRVVLKAESRRSAPVLMTEITVDAGRYPYLSWSWETREDCFSGGSGSTRRSAFRGSAAVPHADGPTPAIYLC